MDCLLVICPLCFHTVVLIGAIYGIYLVSIFPLYDENNLVYLIPICVRFLQLLENTGGKHLEKFLLTHIVRGFHLQLVGKGECHAWELFTSWWSGAV